MGPSLERFTPASENDDMRTISHALIVLFCLLALSAFSCQNTESLKASASTEAPEVLVVTGGHGFDEKEFPKAFSKCERMKLDIVPHEKFVDMLADGSAAQRDAVVLYNFKTKLTETQRARFIDMLDHETGLIALHHGVSAYPEWTRYPEIIGCKYFLKPQGWKGEEHPKSGWKHDVEMKVHIAAEGHPVTAGLKDFTLNDETYCRQWFDPQATVLLTTEEETSDRVLAHVTEYDDSPVAYIQLGHGAHAFNNPNYQQLLARAIRWASIGE